MAKHAEVDVFHCPVRDGAGLPPHPRVRVFPVERRDSFKAKLLRYSLLQFDYAFLADAVLAAGGRYDVIYAHDFPTAWPARKLRRRFGARVLYDVHDLYLETLNQTFPENPSFPRSVLHATARFLMRTTGASFERGFVRECELVVTTTESYVGYLRERYGLKDALVLPNYPERREVEPSDRIYDACGIPRGTSIVLYHGLLGRGRSLETIVRSAAHLAEGSALVLVGDGQMREGLKVLAAGPGMRGKVYFHDPVPYADLLSFASGASLGLILIEHINLSKEYALANKLTEYMASGVAVLASDSPENRRILGAADAGYLVAPSTPEALGARINELLADRAALAGKGRNGRKAFLDRFHWEAHEPAFERAFLALLGAA
jgi:glycosyltransferase involved in cell wall biosynthesis